MTDIKINPGIEGATFESVVYDKKNFSKYEQWPETIIKAAELIEECFNKDIDGGSAGFDVENIIIKDDLINARKYFQIPVTLYGEKLNFGLTDQTKREQIQLMCNLLNDMFKEYSFSFSYASSSFVAVAK